MAETLSASARWIWPKVQRLHSSAHFPRAFLTRARGEEQRPGISHRPFYCFGRNGIGLGSGNWTVCKASSVCLTEICGVKLDDGRA